MVHRHIHYEAAFEDYIRSRGWPYIPVDEQRKAIFSGARIKSFDFLVYRPGQTAWLVDIKGRKFPYEGEHGKRYWENWVTRDDIEGLSKWEAVFGEDFEPVFVFVYWIIGRPAVEPSSDVHQFRGEYYALLLVSAREYAALARERSPKWNTVSVPVRDFRRLVRPMDGA